MSEVAERAVQAALNGQMTYCKFLSANDTGVTGGHQSGIYVAKQAVPIIFDVPGRRGENKKRLVKVKWQDGSVTESCFTYYGKGSRNEYRITRFGKGFPFLQPEYTGALFVFVKDAPEDYRGFFLNTEEEIDAFLGAFDLSPSDTNNLIKSSTYVSSESESHIDVEAAIKDYIAGISDDYFSDEDLSYAARSIQSELFHDDALAIINPDKMLLDWSAIEYKLSRELEENLYGNRAMESFEAADDTSSSARERLARRRDRASSSFVHHLEAIFDANGIEYDSQVHTEGRNRADFLFPSAMAYYDESFSIDDLVFLGAKTTCKDRWRQVLSEADRFKGRSIYLCTMQQGISAAQMDEMQSEHVTLVVPKDYHKSYPRACRDRLWTVKQFVDYVQAAEGK